MNSSENVLKSLNGKAQVVVTEVSPTEYEGYFLLIEANF
jgi:hypothetical protein